MTLLSIILWVILGGVLSTLGHSWKTPGYWLINGLVLAISITSVMLGRGLT